MVNRVVRKDCKVQDGTEAYLKKSGDLNQGGGGGSGHQGKGQSQHLQSIERGSQGHLSGFGLGDKGSVIQ